MPSSNRSSTADWWEAYQQVNERFAEAAAELAAPGATVWVHDYQLQLVPQLLRRLRPDVRIGFFLHIPFPPVELFMRLPWRTQIIQGLLGADLIGFQLPGGARNFSPAGQVAGRGRDHRRHHRVRRPHHPGRPPTRSRSTRPNSPRWPPPRGSTTPPSSSGTTSAIRARSSWGSTGWTTPRASTSGCGRSASCWPRATRRSRTR